MRAIDADALRTCALDRAVVATVASATYRRPLLRLAVSAHAVGFPCLVVQPYVPLNLSSTSGVRQLSTQVPLLPRPKWCGVGRYGWRRSHLYRSRMWHTVLSAGYDLLAVDLDWSFADIHEIPLRPPGSLLTALRAARTPAGEIASVIAFVDSIGGGGEKLFNVGLMWVASTTDTTELARRCARRSFAGWEQGLFNEELNFGLPAISCCHVTSKISDCNLAAHLRKLSKVHDFGHKGVKAAEQRVVQEGSDQCTETQPRAPPAPPTSSYVWSEHVGPISEANLLFAWENYPNTSMPGRSGWREDADNALLYHSEARCSDPSNVCLCTERRDDDDDASRVNDLERWQRLFARQPELCLRGSGFQDALRANNKTRKAFIKEKRMSESEQRRRQVVPLPPLAANGTVSLREWLAYRPRPKADSATGIMR